MFKNLKEIHELKKTKLQLEVLLLSKIYDTVNGVTDVLEIANKLKDVDQKDIVSELVKNIKNNETKKVD